MVRPPAGDVLNCNIYDVATHAAIELKADKLIIMRRVTDHSFDPRISIFPDSSAP